jgi:hypothetical protein
MPIGCISLQTVCASPFSQPFEGLTSLQERRLYHMQPYSSLSYLKNIYNPVYVWNRNNISGWKNFSGDTSTTTTIEDEHLQ